MGERRARSPGERGGVACAPALGQTTAAQQIVERLLGPAGREVQLASASQEEDGDVGGGKLRFDAGLLERSLGALGALALEQRVDQEAERRRCSQRPALSEPGVQRGAPLALGEGGGALAQREVRRPARGDRKAHRRAVGPGAAHGVRPEALGELGPVGGGECELPLERTARGRCARGRARSRARARPAARPRPSARPRASPRRSPRRAPAAPPAFAPRASARAF